MCVFLRGSIPTVFIPAVTDPLPPPFMAALTTVDIVVNTIFLPPHAARRAVLLLLFDFFATFRIVSRLLAAWLLVAADHAFHAVPPHWWPGGMRGRGDPRAATRMRRRPSRVLSSTSSSPVSSDTSFGWCSTTREPRSLFILRAVYYTVLLFFPYFICTRSVSRALPPVRVRFVLRNQNIMLSRPTWRERRACRLRRDTGAAVQCVYVWVCACVRARGCVCSVWARERFFFGAPNAFPGRDFWDNLRKWLSRWLPLRRRHQPCSPRARATCCRSSTAPTLPCPWAPNRSTTTITTVTITPRTPRRSPSPTYSARSRSTASSSCAARRHPTTDPARPAAPAAARPAVPEPCPLAEVTTTTTTTAPVRSRPPPAGTCIRSFRWRHHPRRPNTVNRTWSRPTGIRPRGTERRPTIRGSQVSYHSFIHPYTYRSYV